MDKRKGYRSRFTIEENKSYWESPDTVSIIDSNLHKLEMAFVQRLLKQTDIMADIGCGNGDATIEYAKKVRECLGIERSSHLREVASAKVSRAGPKNLKFVVGDILDLEGFDNCFDVVVTQRVLINLPTWVLQKKAISNVHRCLKKGGLYILIENTHDANDIMNEYRRKVGLQPIPIHWHNNFLHLQKFKSYIKNKFFIKTREGFNLYYFLTRVYAQMFASFTGSGRAAKADPIFVKSDQAARVLSEQFGNKIVFKGNPVFGPIQGIVLKKI